MKMLFEKVEVGGRFFLRNLTLYPLAYRGNGYFSDILSLNEGISSGVIQLKDEGKVNSISVTNTGSWPVLILEGESLVGARQDRILNITSIVESETSVVLPVSCVEQNRWSGGKDFSSSLTLAFPSLRSLLRNSVTKSLKSKSTWEADQQAIWREVKDTLTLTKTRSMTQSMHDMYNSLKEEVNRYLEQSGNLENINGYMVFVEDKFVALDLFATYDLFKKYERKLLESYAMQGILHRFGRWNLKRVNITPQNLDKLDGLDYDAYKGISSELHLRYSGDFLSEISFDSEERFIYASVLPSHV